MDLNIRFTVRLSVECKDVILKGSSMTANASLLQYPLELPNSEICISMDSSFVVFNNTRYKKWIESKFLGLHQEFPQNQKIISYWRISLLNRLQPSHASSAGPRLQKARSFFYFMLEKSPWLNKSTKKLIQWLPKSFWDDQSTYPIAKPPDDHAKHPNSQLQCTRQIPATLSSSHPPA